MTVLSGLIPVFALLALGVAVRRVGLLLADAAGGLKRLAANVALAAYSILPLLRAG